MRATSWFLAGAFLLVAQRVPAAPPAAEPVDLDAVNRIRDEGLHRSRVMETLAHLTDEIGPRLTGSPALKRADEWVLERMREWGLENTHLEAWGPFGRGWSFERCAVHALKPRSVPIRALPKAWTPGTDGPRRGTLVRARLQNDADLEKLDGKLEGKILLLDPTPSFDREDEALFDRLDDDELSELRVFPVRSRRRGGARSDWRKRYERRLAFRKKLNPWLAEQGVVATLSASGVGDGILRVSGAGSRKKDESPGVCSLVVARETYAWLSRLVDAGEEVELEVDVKARFHDEDDMAYNSVGEIPGTDLRHEVVLLGAHLDSWHAGTGATDNGAGSAVVLEAARILSRMPTAPRRTIRFALWSGEEQGLLGSRAYVRDHLAYHERTEEDEKKEPSPFEDGSGPLVFRPEYEDFCAYFNLDNGSGRIRGVYCEENSAVAPIFSAWIEPFRDLGVDTVTLRRTGGTDHMSFDAVGLPGFQFVQDSLDYFTRTHHTDLDVLDHAVAEDLMQASTVMAAFAWFAANRPEKLPRRPLPPSEGTDDS